MTSPLPDPERPRRVLAAADAQRYLEAVMRSTRTLVWVARVGVDGTMRELYGGPGAELLLGFDPAATDEPHAAWRSAVHVDDLARFDGAMERARGGASFDIEYRVHAADGSVRTVRDQAVVTTLADGTRHIDGIATDVTAERAAQVALGDALELARRRAAEVEELLRDIQRLATTDVLTDLPNRRHGASAFGATLAAGGPVGLALLDVDRFKAVNDVHGHAAGDHVLVEVARRLRGALADRADVVARWGGEEFAILLHGIPDDAALAIACERLRACLAETPIDRGDGVLIPVTGSVGAARPDAGGEDLDLVLARADRALYAAKEGGRDRVVIGRPNET